MRARLARWICVAVCGSGLGCAATAPRHAPAQDEAEAEAPAKPPAKTPGQKTRPRPVPPPTPAEQKERLRVAIEGLIAFLEGPQGTFGEPSGMADQLMWDVLSDGMAGGARLGAAYELGARDWLEARGTWYSEFDDQATQTGVFGFRPTPGGALGVSASNTATFAWSAKVWSGELNWWHLWRDLEEMQASFVVGFRYLDHDERVSATNWLTDFGAGADPFVASEVQNRFLGGQAGLGATYRPGGRKLELVGSIKALFGAMLREVEVRDQAIFSGGLHVGRIEEDDFVFGFDLDVGIRIWFSERLAATLGYNLLFVNDIVRAHDALDFTQSATGAVQPTTRTLDTLVIHSVMIGVILDF
ncbi:MAG: BBP7 family outer membrane beta-barrel protein [Planctomycetota bacterium]|jgi:hypothetical protein